MLLSTGGCPVSSPNCQKSLILSWKILIVYLLALPCTGSSTSGKSAGLRVVDLCKWTAGVSTGAKGNTTKYDKCTINFLYNLLFFKDFDTQGLFFTQEICKRYEGRSISDAPDPLPVVWSSWNFACAMIYISMGYVANYSSELIVVSDLQVFELSQVWNGACWVSRSDPVFVFERTHTTGDFWWNERNLWW